MIPRLLGQLVGALVGTGGPVLLLAVLAALLIGVGVML
jgi:hypothetical protein